MQRTALEPALLVEQGLFYLVTGLWPVFDRRSFERVSGRKTDFWLVRTVGLLLATAGTAMLLAARRGKASPEARCLGMGMAGSLAAIDVAYGLPGRIPRIYLADAVGELAIVGAWAALAVRREETV